MHADQTLVSDHSDESADIEPDSDARSEFHGEGEQSVFASMAALERLAQLLLPDSSSEPSAD